MLYDSEGEGEVSKNSLIFFNCLEIRLINGEQHFE